MRTIIYTRPESYKQAFYMPLRCVNTGRDGTYNKLLPWLYTHQNGRIRKPHHIAGQYIKNFHTMTSNETLAMVASMSTNTNLEVDFLVPILVVGHEPVVTEVFTSTPQLQRRFRRNRPLLAQAAYSLSQLHFVAHLFKRTHEFHVHRSGMRMTARVATTAAIFPQPPPPRVSRLTLFATYFNRQDLANRHHRKTAHAERGTYREIYLSTDFGDNY